MSLSLPADYTNFLRTGATLQAYSLTNAPIVLTPIPEAELTLDAVWVQVDETDLREDDPHACDGAYRVEIVSLVRCDTPFDQGYGILVWVPGESCFGAYDTEHAVLYVFRDTPWEVISADIDAYIGILGGVESPHVIPLAPWHRYPWTSWEDIEAAGG